MTESPHDKFTDPGFSRIEDVRPGLVLGRYELLTPIASGGMAQVWAARLKGARQFQKIVAIKTMLPKLSEDEHFEQMFLDEASLASQIRHPNAVETLDLGEQGGVLYLVMEWIEGVPLNQLLKAAKAVGGIPYHVATRIAMGACAGLHAAHELHNEKGQHVGLVHRDISPQNILVTYDGVTKVVDFGVAKATALGGGATVAGQIKGKVSYMAPEQVNGEGLDRRADVFAMGIVLYALTTGKHPFRRESEAATMYNICSSDKVVAPSRVVEDYPAELEPIVLRALEKNREERFATADEMLRALDALPSHLRAGSDGDVGEFLRSLLGDKRTEQKERIALAVEHANRRAEEGISSPYHPEPLPSRPHMASMVGGELSQVNAALSNHSRRNRIFGIIGLVALAIACGGIASVFLAKPETRTEVRVIEKVIDENRAELERLKAIDAQRKEEDARREAERAAAEAQAKAEAEAKAKAEAEAKAQAQENTKAPTPRPKPTPKPTSKPSVKPAPEEKPPSNWKYDSGL